MGGGACGILYGCELVTAAPAGKDSPDELLTTPLRIWKQISVLDFSPIQWSTLRGHLPIPIWRRGRCQSIGGSILFFVHKKILREQNTIVSISWDSSFSSLVIYL